jgi:hypothetical protein
MFQPWSENVPGQKVMKTRAPDQSSRNVKFAIACSCAGAAESFPIHALEFATRRILERGCVALLVALSLGISARAQNPPEDLSRLSVEDLMNVEVTSVSRKEQKASQTAAAIFVITQEDIRRSGRSAGRLRNFKHTTGRRQSGESTADDALAGKKRSSRGGRFQ